MRRIQKAKDHKGKVVARFEDRQGNELSDLNMCDDVVIVFTDGARIILGIDHCGVDSYISQFDS